MIYCWGTVHCLASLNMLFHNQLTGLMSPIASPGLFSSIMVLAHARPNTTRSSRELAPSRFAPWTLAHATSPQAYRPRITLSFFVFASYVMACNSNMFVRAGEWISSGSPYILFVHGYSINKTFPMQSNKCTLKQFCKDVLCVTGWCIHCLLLMQKYVHIVNTSKEQPICTTIKEIN